MKRLMPGAAVLCLLVSQGAATPFARAADAAPLTVCVEQDNPPFASVAAGGGATGIDVDVAQALGERLRRPVRLEWVVEPNRGGFGKALRQSIGAGKCDLFMGVPASPEMAATLRAQGLAITRDYVTLGYVFVSRGGAPVVTETDARRAKRIGVPSATPGDLYLHAKRLNRVPYGGSAAVLQALRSGEVDLGLVWTPAIAGEERFRELVISRAPADDPALRTDLAIAVRASDAALRDQIDAGLNALDGARALKEIAARHRLLDLERAR